jgi:ATP synthase protein I
MSLTNPAKDPVTSMLVGGAVPCAVVAVLVLVASAVAAGGRGALGALVGSVLVVAVFSLTLAAMHVTRRVAPELTLGMALLTYTTKAVALGIALIAWRDATWMSTTALGASVLACTLAWLLGQVRSYAALRVPVYGGAS